MITINMLTMAHTVKGQGVYSAGEEQMDLVKNDLKDTFTVCKNKFKLCDIMHYHTINFRFFLSLPLAKMKGKTVGYVHFVPETVDSGLNLPWIAKKVFYKYILWFYNAMDYIVVVNPYFIDVLKKYGIDEKKVTYIPNFVDEKKFFPTSITEKQAVREKFHLSQNKFTVFCAGQLQTRKGIFDFIEIAKMMPEVQFVWAGNFAFGSITDGYKEVSEVMKSPPDNLKFLGLVDREEMNGLYNAADLMFLASYEELFPMIILEAMNCKTPILLRDLDIYENILFDYYLRGNNNEEFMGIINKLKNDKDYYNLACEKSFEGHLFYSRDHVKKMWLDFYTKVKGRN